jgi:L-amino acid N-acyltransferase YncA
MTSETSAASRGSAGGTVNIRAATTADAAAIAHIYNQAIEERGATFETAPRSAVEMVARVEGDARYPVLVAERDDLVIGWAGLSSYRSRDCYRGVGEFSIYIDRAARGQAVGKMLLNALVDDAARLGYWKLLSRIFPFNTGSRALCHACGFREVGTYERHAQLDGRWLDVIIVERLISENQPGGDTSEAVTDTSRPTSGSPA